MSEVHTMLSKGMQHGFQRTRLVFKLNQQREPLLQWGHRRNGLFLRPLLSNFLIDGAKDALSTASIVSILG